jgi:hypothetical protein
MLVTSQGGARSDWPWQAPPADYAGQVRILREWIAVL